MKTTFKIIKNDWDEYEVQVFEGGKINHARTYFTDDKEDAQLTKQAMIDEDTEYKRHKHEVHHNCQV